MIDAKDANEWNRYTWRRLRALAEALDKESPQSLGETLLCYAEDWRVEVESLLSKPYTFEPGVAAAMKDAGNSAIPQLHSCCGGTDKEHFEYCRKGKQDASDGLVEGALMEYCRKRGFIGCEEKLCDRIAADQERIESLGASYATMVTALKERIAALEEKNITINDHEIEQILACLDDGTYTQQEIKDFSRLCHTVRELRQTVEHLSPSCAALLHRAESAEGENARLNEDIQIVLEDVQRLCKEAFEKDAENATLKDYKEKYLLLSAQHVREVERLEAENAELRRRLEEYALFMDEAVEDVADWGSYASEYFQGKHGLQKDIDKWKARAMAIRNKP